LKKNKDQVKKTILMEEEKVPHLSSEWKELGNKFF
jgi:hypothetical protein